MPKSTDPEPCVVRIYSSLIRLYPRPFREVYAREMLLVFREQVRAAFRYRGRWGVTIVWLQALYDLTLTVVAERWSIFKGGIPMLRRGLDIILSLWMLWLGLPFLLPIALLIKLESPGPVFYTSQRGGLNGRLFTLLKLRSMTNDDPVRRVTRFGSVLRWTRLDEYPQFYNVFRGDMSLFGPRPYYPGAAEPGLLVVRPGLVPWFNR